MCLCYFNIDLYLPRIFTTKDKVHNEIKKAINSNYDKLPDKKLVNFSTGIRNSGSYDVPTYILKGVDEKDLHKYYIFPLKSLDQIEKLKQHKDVWYYYVNDK